MKGFKAHARLTVPTPKLEHNGILARAKADFAILKGMREGARVVATELKQQLDANMQSTTWDWPFETRRVNGTTVASPRNIVDTGRLRDSGKVLYAQYPMNTSFSINYSAPYANLVHYGGAIQPYGNRNAPTVMLPGRPWVTATMKGGHGFQKYDLKKPYGAALMAAWPFGFK